MLLLLPLPVLPSLQSTRPYSTVARGDASSLNNEQLRVQQVRAVTGVLASREEERDVKFASFSLMVGGNQLVTDCKLELNQGCRYGLVGTNGCGKSNVLSCLAQMELPVPDHLDMYHLHEEAPATEMTGVEAVINHIVVEAQKLEDLSEEIIEENGPDDDRLEAIYERLDELDPTGSEPRARLIMSGLGFADHLVPMDRKTKHMSGGWRMRVSLGKSMLSAYIVEHMSSIIKEFKLFIYYSSTFHLNISTKQQK